MANNDSPTLDGIWFRPYIGKARNDDIGMTTDASSVGNTIPPTAKTINIESVETNADDFLTLPALADVANGHEIIILGNAGSDFEVRTPTTSNEKINNVDSDGSNEYLFTDTQVHRFIKVSNTQGWIAYGFSNLGAIVTAVVPD